ncbi:MAG: DUF1501 domain-containing protein [Planctomycetota bacterium]
MDLHDSTAYTRRDFLWTSLALASAAASVPAFVSNSARGMTLANGTLSSLAGVPQDRVLVVVQLGGGNDGLNTVIPFGEDEYYRRRPSLGIREAEVGRLSGRGTDGLGLHPALDPIRELYDDGLAGIVQGVGYPNPNRSHFKSMDIWHTADTSGTGEGWLGRYMDSQCCGFGKGESGTADSNAGGQADDASSPAIAIGREAPLAMQGREQKPVAFETPDLFRWTGEDIHSTLSDPYAQVTRQGVREDVAPESNAAFLMKTALDAQISSEQIRQAVARRPEVQYPRNGLGRDLAMIASMIKAGLPTRVYYASTGGYDTHAGQGGANGQHANLLRQFAQAMNAFQRDLKSQGNDSRVLTVTFSEFGRRVGQNASGGTDHGTAAPMFLFGPMVQPGIHSKHPSLKDLDNGDLKFNTDFRSVYATVLEDWLKADSREVLESRYRTLRLLKQA